MLLLRALLQERASVFELSKSAISKSMKHRSLEYYNQISLRRVFHHVGMWFTRFE